ncbi:MAG: hypothetical protein KME40_23310 [Komarekiella atlantica HA4396-MV6]|jgi:hypothetical protein|nr:hypothetical protein [Komarekiella atlantica HA4396-MV6]
MVQLLVKEESKYWINVATSLSTELVATASTVLTVTGEIYVLSPSTTL